MNFTVDRDITSAKTIDKSVYLSPEVWENCKEKIFAKTFQYIGCTDELEQTNVVPVDFLKGFLDEPLLLTKESDGTIHCLSNVCTHRGNLIAKQPCKVGRLACNYHGRQFKLDGTFMHMPEFKEVKNFPCEADDLHALTTFKIGKLLFATLQKNLDPLPFFSNMLERMNWYPWDALHFRKEFSNEFKVQANWALYCENYLEGFHIPFVHKSLNAVLDFEKYTTELFALSNVQVGIAKEGEASFDLPFRSPDNGKNIAAYYFWIFPNIMFNFYPWGLSLNVIEPVGLAETRVRFLTFMLDEDTYNTGAGSGLDQVELEDEEVVEAVQKGIRSRFYAHGRYAPKREQGTHHFHCLLNEFLAKK